MRTAGLLVIVLFFACTKGERGSSPEAETANPPAGAEPATATESEPGAGAADAPSEPTTDERPASEQAAGDGDTAQKEQVGDDQEVSDEPGEGSGDCVTKCVQANQMRAVSPEAIEEDCRAECASK